MVIPHTCQVEVAASLEIQLLGTLTIVRSGVVVPLPPSKKARALLAYLVATGRPHLRERLCDLLWDGPSDPRSELRWTLSRIRPVIDENGIRRLNAEHERVWFEPHGARIDLVELRALLGRDSAAAPIGALEQAAALLRGELLEALDLPGCYRYHGWCSGERENVRALQATVLGSLAERLVDRPDDALRYARTWVAADPFAQPAHAHVIRLLGELGRGREAIEYYDDVRRMLARELGASPAEIEEARQRIRRPAAQPVSAATPGTAAEPPWPSHDPGSDDLPALAGRAAECALIDDLVGRAAARVAAPALLLLGEPGIGKTRLLQEVIARVRARSGTVLTGRSFEAEMVRPYGAWIDAFRALPAARVPEHLRAALSPLLPHAAAGMASASDRQELFDAVVELLTSVAADGPAALVFDDLQWLDEASAALLHFTMRTAGCKAGILLATAGRAAELEENASVVSLVRALKRERCLTQLELAPLDTDSISAVVSAVAPAADAARVYAESGGNPLYAIEVARALVRDGDAASDTLDHLIDDRLARLPQPVLELLPWAAALGRSFDLDLLGQVTDLTPAELMRRVAELERWRVLQTTDEVSNAYDFTHDLLRAGAYRRLSGPRRRLAHQHIASVLATLPDADGALAADLAHHAALAGDSATAAQACFAAGIRCLRIFAQRDAAELARRGLHHAERLPLQDRLETQAELLRLFVHAEAARGREREVEAEIARVVGEAQRAGLAGAAHIALHALSYLHWREGDLVRAASDSLLAAEAARAADPRTTAHAFADTARCLAHLERDVAHAETLLDEAETIARQLGIELLDIPWARGLLCQYAAEHDDAARYFTRALQLARAEQHRWAECDCLTRLTMIDLETGQPARALARCAELIPVATQMGEGSEAPFATALDALARHALGHADAAAILDAALAQLRRVDSNLLLAYTLVSAAEIDLRSGTVATALERAQEALHAAERVGGHNLVVHAHALLALIAKAAGGPAAASPHLAALHAELTRSANLSVRAHTAAIAILGTRASTPEPTLIPTPVPTLHA